ncbi:coenzyme F420-reducing hydrogenase delta subunit [Desulfosalsimonas propionicica]|uniref:Coenzyme F420-reducing hydrogenase delta subunit n=1 Tax=Desulfosalsimonas propionicica TaxID=332175 RepID=A0A7W0HJD6_9BACT|nr:hydrogenase iron-sulfur subunit [Desulfosalsimonas propionicica]MBA2880082.1 coenzyme F420-reducing hydrogenase delta subunit [Desulfosalsimonas propionicica]
MTTDFEPEILMFCCRYCAYAAADLAGSMRLTYPANIKILQVPCTGRVDVIHLLKALETGVDGVFVAGCLQGECHFLQGNLQAEKRVLAVKQILCAIGMDPERVGMYNLSSAMGARFAEIADEIVKKINDLGPNLIKRAHKNVTVHRI